MSSANRLRFTTVVTAAALLACSVGLLPQKGNALMNNVRTSVSEPDKRHPYIGMWITADGHIRHNLLPNMRYDEARGRRESAYQGRYEVRGNHIDYWDDTGFTADGDFVDDVLYHAGMVLYRDGKNPR
jgi:hypothetical protein